MFTGVAEDFRFALRILAKAPGFTLTVICTIALTIALSTVVFSVLDAVLLRPLPYNGVDRIVAITAYSPQGYTQTAPIRTFRTGVARAAPSRISRSITTSKALTSSTGVAPPLSIR